MASTAQYLEDDFKSYYLDNVEANTNPSSTTTLLEYPDPQSISGIDPSSLTYDDYSSNLSNAFSFPSVTSHVHPFGSPPTRSNIYHCALNVVPQTSSPAQSESPGTSANLPSELEFNEPNGEDIKPRRRRNGAARSSRQKSSTLSISSQRSRTRKKRQTISNGEISEDIEMNNHDNDNDVKAADDDIALSDDGDPSKSRRERALERNRLAASKCREKKKMHHQELEARARRLGEEHEELITTFKILQDQLFAMKSRFLEHVSCGCTGIREYMKTTVRPMTAEGIALYQALGNDAANHSDGAMLEFGAYGRLLIETTDALVVPNATDMGVDQFGPQNDTGVD
jgi:bZIP transcription factor